MFDEEVEISLRPLRVTRQGSSVQLVGQSQSGSVVVRMVVAWLAAPAGFRQMMGCAMPAGSHAEDLAAAAREVAVEAAAAGDASSSAGRPPWERLIRDIAPEVARRDEWQWEVGFHPSAPSSPPRSPRPCSATQRPRGGGDIAFPPSHLEQRLLERRAVREQRRLEQETHDVPSPMRHDQRPAMVVPCNSERRICQRYVRRRDEVWCAPSAEFKDGLSAYLERRSLLRRPGGPWAPATVVSPR